MIAYVRHPDGTTTPMEVVRTKSEPKELQSVLEGNPDLLPGDQINPDEPRRWLRIEREMPVPDPRTGSDRWSIDLLFSDQSAIPTFIECKRFEDTRSRREVIGQMMDYAANGQYYWSSDDLKRRAEAIAVRRGMSLEQEFESLRPDDELDIDSYFRRLEDNLREGQVRLVFYLEEAPTELKVVVDFLNKQMERSEVLIVEAKQYRDGETNIIVPSLFGYTEEARQVKRTFIKVTSGARRRWDYESFFEDAAGKLDFADLERLRKFYDSCESMSCEIKWGAGQTNGSFKLYHPALGKKAFIVVNSVGRLEIYFAHLSGTAELEKARNDLKTAVQTELGLTVPENSGYPMYESGKWLANVDVLIEIIRNLVKQ